MMKIIKLVFYGIYTRFFRYFCKIFISIIAMLIGFQLYSMFFQVYERDYDICDNIDSMSVLKSQYTSFDFEYYDKLNKIIYDLKEKYNVGFYQNTDLKVESEIIPLIRADNCVLEKMNIFDEENNKLSLNSNSQYIEVAVGKNLYNKYPVGHEFKDIFGNNYKTVSTIKEGQLWLSDNFLDLTKIINLDNCIIVNPREKDYSMGTAITYSNNIIVLEDDKNRIKELQLELKLYEKDGVFLKLISIKDEMYKEIKHNVRIYGVIIVVYGIILCLSIISIFTISLIDMKNQNKKFGILQTLGYEYKDIVFMIVLDSIVCFFIQYFVSISIAYYMQIKINDIVNFCVIILYLSLYFIVDIFSLIKIKRTKITELLKGKLYD